MWRLKRYFCSLLIVSAVKWQLISAFDDIPSQLTDNSSSSVDMQDSNRRNEQNIKDSLTEDEKNIDKNNVDDLIDSIVENAVLEESAPISGTLANNTQNVTSKGSSDTSPAIETLEPKEDLTITPVETTVHTEASMSSNDIIDEIIDLDQLDKDIENTTIIDVSENPPSKKPQIIVEDYLTSLSYKELEKLCVERGFDVKAPEGNIDDIARHSHYVEAAQRCLRIDDEINAVIAKNPDLAAELEAEVERMKQEKERLTKEREEMLAEKALLEQQLLDAGILIADDGKIKFSKNNQTSDFVDKVGGETETLSEVLLESFRLLWLRVYQDMQLVQSVAGKVLKPVFNSLKIVWNYSQPTVDLIGRRVVRKLDQLRKVEQIHTVIESLSAPMSIAWTNTMLPILTSIIRTAKILLKSLGQIELVEQAVAPLMPFLAPATSEISRIFRSLKESVKKTKVSASEWFKDALNDT